jgi:hypothetical protein
MNGDVCFVSARTKEDAIVMLDERENAEGAEISQIRHFMVDFRLNDEGDLELAELGECDSREGVPSSARGHEYRARDAIRRHYSRKAKPLSAKQCRRNGRARSSRPVASARNRGGQNTPEEDGCLCGVRESSC